MSKYEASLHAIERTVQRLNIPREHAAHHLNQLMETAVEVEHSGNGIAYEHPKSKTRIIVDEKKKIIITIYPHEQDERVSKMALLSDFYLIEVLKNAFDERYKLLNHQLNSLEVDRSQKMVELSELKARYHNAVTDRRKELIINSYKESHKELENINSEISLLNSKIQCMINEVERITCLKMFTPYSQFDIQKEV